MLEQHTVIPTPHSRVHHKIKIIRIRTHSPLHKNVHTMVHTLTLLHDPITNFDPSLVVGPSAGSVGDVPDGSGDGDDMQVGVVGVVTGIIEVCVVAGCDVGLRALLMALMISV